MGSHVPGQQENEGWGASHFPPAPGGPQDPWGSSRVVREMGGTGIAIASNNNIRTIFGAPLYDKVSSQGRFTPLDLVDAAISFIY